MYTLVEKLILYFLYNNITQVYNVHDIVLFEMLSSKCTLHNKQRNPILILPLFSIKFHIIDNQTAANRPVN